MTMSITRRDLDRAISMTNRQRVMAERSQAKKEGYMGALMQTAEVGAGALGSALLTGRYGPMAIGPVPLDLLSGLALHALGFTDILGDYSQDLHNIGDGMIAAYLVKLGVGLGTAWRARAGEAPLTVTMGNDPYAFADPNAAYGAMGPAYGGYAPWNATPGAATDAELQQIAAMQAMG